jgi:membrane protein implicated in regulation of membrane protease activity
MDLDLDTDHGFDGLVPFNLMCTCFALIVFGSLGRLFAPYMTNTLFSAVIIALLALVSFIAYLVLYKYVIVKLKRNNPLAITSAEIVGSVGKLTLRVTQDSDGVVSVLDSTGAAISYTARVCDFYKLDDTGRIDQGTEVVITGVNKDANIYYVHPLYE